MREHFLHEKKKLRNLPGEYIDTLSRTAWVMGYMHQYLLKLCLSKLSQ